MELEDKVLVSMSTYVELLTDQNTLHLLEAAGVDNWEGYEAALGLLSEVG